MIRAKDRLRSEYRNNLLDAPSVAWDGRCSVCGRPATNHHHVIPKGAGGTRHEGRIPTVLLCGGGNASGCHGWAHSRRLHLNYDSGDWLFCITEPMDDEEAWERYRDDYRVLPAWDEMKRWSAPVYGRRA